MTDNVSLKFFIAEKYDPYLNLAYEEYFQDTVSENEVILYLWQNADCVVIGKNQNAYRECHINKAKEDKVKIARRNSGGGAVFHDLGNLNFSFIAKKKNYNIQKQLSVIIDALNDLNIFAKISGRNDIETDGKKISGNAFFYKKDNLLHHGTLLINTDPKKIQNYLNVNLIKLKAKNVSSVVSRVTTLSAINENITLEKLRFSILSSFSKLYNYPLSEITKSDIDDSKIKKLFNKFSNEKFIFGENTTFEFTVEDRFDIGMLSICFNTNNGVIKKVSVFTDSLDYNISNEISNAFLNKSFSKENLLDISLSIENENKIFKYVSKLLSKEVF